MQELKNPIEKLSYYISRKIREKKFKHFLLELKPKNDDMIVDVGVNNEEYSESDNYLEKHYLFPENITAVSKDDTSLFEKRYPHIKSVLADGRRLPFPDNNFDISYSNAVIEHVGDKSDQISFLKELLRVSARGYFTTPNRLFPIEVHTRVPLLHLILSKKYFDSFLVLIGKKWATGNYMHLLSKKELLAIIKDAGITNYTISSNFLFGLPITFSVIWKK